jgi:hypothetical protein
MTTDPQELQTFRKRLGRVEKENRLMKRTGLVLLSLVALAVVMGQARPNRTVEATAFVLKDDSGIVRAKLFVDPLRQGPSLSLYDSSGVARVTLAQGDKGSSAGLFLYNDPPERYGGAEMLLTPDGATVLLASAKHGNLIALSTNSPTVPGPALEISDAEGYSATLGASESKAPGTGERRTTSAASISLTDKNRKVIWSAP